MTDDFSLYAPSGEHRAIRAALRSLCEAKVAPFSVEVDAEARYPKQAAQALQGAHRDYAPDCAQERIVRSTGSDQVQRIVMARQSPAGVQSEV